MKGTIWLAGLALTVVLLGQTAHARDFRATIGSGHTPEALVQVELADAFFVPEVEKRVAERTQHTIRFTKAWGGSVARVGEVLEAVEANILNFGVLSLPFYPSQLFLHNWTYWYPFGPGDVDLILRISQRLYEEIPELKSTFHRYNQIYLGQSANDDYDLVGTFAVETLEDVQGKRVSAAGPNLPWVTGVGATPIQGALPEWYTGLQTGLYEAVLSSAIMVAGNRLYEVAPIYSKVGFGAIAVSVLTVNRDFFNGLPPEVQEIIREVGEEYTARQAARLNERREDGFQRIRAAGGRIVEVSNAERTRWAARLENLPQQFVVEAERRGLPGRQLMCSYERMLREEGFVPVRDWELGC